MKYKETVTLVSDEPLDFNRLFETDNLLRERGIAIALFDLDFYCLEKCQELIKEKGATHILSIKRFQEAVIPKSVDSDHARDLLINILRDKLHNLSPSHDLIIVDNYLFPKGLADRQGYLQVFEDVFGLVISRLEQIKFVTKPSYDSLLYNEIENLLKSLNHQITVLHSTTDDFHDRFWIVDESKGLFVGTSLNGIGKRYALVDDMHDADTEEIVRELKKLHLI